MVVIFSTWAREERANAWESLWWWCTMRVERGRRWWRRQIGNRTGGDVAIAVRADFKGNKTRNGFALNLNDSDTDCQHAERQPLPHANLFAEEDNTEESCCENLHLIGTDEDWWLEI